MSLIMGAKASNKSLFIAASNTVNGLVDYDFDNAVEFVYDDELEAWKATVGTIGNRNSWVNEVMISTVRGSESLFKANTLKLKGSVIANSEDLCEGWNEFEAGANAIIKLPVQGVWTVYVDLENSIMTFLTLEYDNGHIYPAFTYETCVNKTEVIVNAVERPFTLDEAVAAGLIVSKEEATDEEKALYNGQHWDNQFFLIANRNLVVDEEVHLSFEYKAETYALVGTQNSQGAGSYLHWAGLGNLDFTDEWQMYDANITIPSQTEGKQDSWTFNLANMKNANTYHFRNFFFVRYNPTNGLITENLIDHEGTKNFMVKEGKGTKAFEFGKKPEADTIKSKKDGKPTTNASYNLAGQKVSADYKGIVIKNGNKLMVK